MFYLQPDYELTKRDKFMGLGNVPIEVLLLSNTDCTKIATTKSVA